MTVISVPETFASDTLAREGERARPWLARIPWLVGELCARWRLRIAGREPWLVIDPKVMRGDAEFGLAPLLWRRLAEAGGPAGLRRRFDVLVDEAGLDAELARGWTLLRAVEYQLWALSMGLPEDPALCATVIDWLGLLRHRGAGP